MTISHTLWLGSEESFHNYMTLEKKHFGLVPQAFSGDEEDVTTDPVFGVKSDRIGLGLLEKVGATTILKVHGSISQRHSWWHPMFPGSVTSYEAIEDALDIVARDESKSKVVMDFATGGGVVRGVDRAARKIRWARQLVGIDAHTEASAFSAGYWLASAAGQISASPMAEVGSIGTLLVTYDMVKQAEQEGITYHVFRAGEFKAMGLPYEEMTEKFSEQIQLNLEKTNKFFLDHVTQTRGLSMGTQGLWGEGKTFYAFDAKEVGLIDRVATLDELLGSSASQTLTSDNRRMDMNISAEKLAQISGGADPKEVLTEEELKHYNASIEETQEQQETAEEQDQEEVAEEETQEPTASADVLELTKTVGRLEAKLEAAEARADELQGQLTAKQTDISALSEVAKVALGNLCTALGRPKELPDSAAGITAKFTELQGEMAKRFKVGQQSSPAALEDVQSGRNFRHNV